MKDGTLYRGISCLVQLHQCHRGADQLLKDSDEATCSWSKGIVIVLHGATASLSSSARPDDTVMALFSIAIITRPKLSYCKPHEKENSKIETGFSSYGYSFFKSARGYLLWCSGVIRTRI